MTEWGRSPGFGLIARCPGCNQYVIFGLSDKKAVGDISNTTLPVLADDWQMKVQIG
jgi:hypothetical protein